MFSFNKYFLKCLCVPGTVLFARIIRVSKADLVPFLVKFTVQWEINRLKSDYKSDFVRKCYKRNKAGAEARIGGGSIQAVITKAILRTGIV